LDLDALAKPDENFLAAAEEEEVEEEVGGGADLLKRDTVAEPDDSFLAGAEEEEEGEEAGGGADLIKRDTVAEPDDSFLAAAEEEEEEEEVAGGANLLDLDTLFLAAAEEEERGEDVEETVGGFDRPPSPTEVPPPPPPPSPPPSPLRVVENDADQGDVVYSDVTVGGAWKEGTEPLATPLAVEAEQLALAADESVYGELDFSKANANGGDGGAGSDDAAVVYGELTFDGGEPPSPSAAGEVVYGKIPAESNLHGQQETPAALAGLNLTNPTDAALPTDVPAHPAPGLAPPPIKQEIYASVPFKADRAATATEPDEPDSADGPPLPQRNPSMRSMRPSGRASATIVETAEASPSAPLDLDQLPVQLAAAAAEHDDGGGATSSRLVAETNLDAATTFVVPPSPPAEAAEQGGASGGDEGVAETDLDAAAGFGTRSAFAAQLAQQRTVRAEARAEAAQLDPGDLSFEQFGALYFTEAVAGAESTQHQRTRLTQPLMKQVWGDGDSQRVLLTWTALLFFLGDAQLAAGQQLTNLETLQLIVNTGKTRENTRNEIYAQICKQVLGNPNRYSHARAWIVMALCGSHFMPRDDFAEVVRRFINAHSPPGYRAFLLQRFTRAETAPTARARSVTALEVNAAFAGKPIQIRVHFYFNSIVVLVDAASTVAEISDAVFNHPIVEREYGFKLYLMGEQFQKRGQRVEHQAVLDDPTQSVIDLISEYEAMGASAGQDWKEMDEHRSWSVVLRKQAFTPWLEAIDNLNLIYRQIWDGMERGEYHTSNEDELAENLAIRSVVSSTCPPIVPPLSSSCPRCLVVGVLNEVWFEFRVVRSHVSL
jgi:hypothetical protein